MQLLLMVMILVMTMMMMTAVIIMTMALKVILIPMIQGLNDMKTAVAEYKNALHQDNMCVEAIACIATHHFYSDQPEIALNYYR